MQKIADLRYASAVLQWDQETYLPPQGADGRGRQLATLNELSHAQFTDSSTGELLKQLCARTDLGDKQKRNAALSLEDYERNKKLKPQFVRKLSETVNRCFHSWLAARKENSFRLFEQPLAELIALKREEANLIGFSEHPYDALMDEFDRGLTVKKLDAIFKDLTPRLSELLDVVKRHPQPDDSFLHLNYPKEKQWDFGIELLKKIHFDFTAGRQDISEHPFTTNFSSRDVRVTTRIDENNFSNMAWSCLHEGGHALYEQGLPEEEYGLPLGEYCSLSIHESQSRLWENNVGRSLLFWHYQYPALQKTFPQQLAPIKLNQFYAAINKISPSLIRTEADEVTYHFHIMIRYELEKKLIEGTLSAADIPEFWNESYKKYLGLDVPDDKQGCLQDVHWSHGSFGYFPTYSLGSLYAAQFFNSITKANSDLEEKLKVGDSLPVWEWLKINIYGAGRYYSSDALCQKVTGETLNPDYFIQYIGSKISDIYK